MTDQPSPLEAGRVCAWCPDPIPARARSDAKYCSTRCRQAAHRFGRERPKASTIAGERMRFAYADPPYPGKSGYYTDHPDYAGEVDHHALIRQLEKYDAWALSTSAEALPRILKIADDYADVRVAAWIRGERPTVAYQPLNGWEPVIYRGARLERRDPDARRVDYLIHHARPRTSDPNRVIGTKPAAFIWWLFALLGVHPGDTLDDLYPGSGGVARAAALIAVASGSSTADP